MAGDTGPVKRCLRCGTAIRKRVVCPSCGYEVLPDSDGPTPGVTSTQGPMKMCAICMESVPEHELMAFAGQEVCADCFESVSGEEAPLEAGQ